MSVQKRPFCPNRAMSVQKRPFAQIQPCLFKNDPKTTSLPKYSHFCQKRPLCPNTAMSVQKTTILSKYSNVCPKTSIFPKHSYGRVKKKNGEIRSRRKLLIANNAYKINVWVWRHNELKGNIKLLGFII